MDVDANSLLKGQKKFLPLIGWVLGSRDFGIGRISGKTNNNLCTARLLK